MTFYTSSSEIESIIKKHSEKRVLFINGKYTNTGKTTSMVKYLMSDKENTNIILFPSSKQRDGIYEEFGIQPIEVLYKEIDGSIKPILIEKGMTVADTFAGFQKGHLRSIPQNITLVVDEAHTASKEFIDFLKLWFEIGKIKKIIFISATLEEQNIKSIVEWMCLNKKQYSIDELNVQPQRSINITFNLLSNLNTIFERIENSLDKKHLILTNSANDVALIQEHFPDTYTLIGDAIAKKTDSVKGDNQQIFKTFEKMKSGIMIASNTINCGVNLKSQTPVEITVIEDRINWKPSDVYQHIERVRTEISSVEYYSKDKKDNKILEYDEYFKSKGYNTSIVNINQRKKDRLISKKFPKMKPTYSTIHLQGLQGMNLFFKEILVSECNRVTPEIRMEYWNSTFGKTSTVKECVDNIIMNRCEEKDVITLISKNKMKELVEVINEKYSELHPEATEKYYDWEKIKREKGTIKDIKTTVLEDILAFFRLARGKDGNHLPHHTHTLRHYDSLTSSGASRRLTIDSVSKFSGVTFYQYDVKSCFPTIFGMLSGQTIQTELPKKEMLALLNDSKKWSKNPIDSALKLGLDWSALPQWIKEALQFRTGCYFILGMIEQELKKTIRREGVKFSEIHDCLITTEDTDYQIKFNGKHFTFHLEYCTDKDYIQGDRKIVSGALKLPQVINHRIRKTDDYGNKVLEKWINEEHKDYNLITFYTSDNQIITTNRDEYISYLRSKGQLKRKDFTSIKQKNVDLVISKKLVIFKKSDDTITAVFRTEKGQEIEWKFSKEKSLRNGIVKDSFSIDGQKIDLEVLIQTLETLINSDLATNDDNKDKALQKIEEIKFELEILGDVSTSTVEDAIHYTFCAVQSKMEDNKTYTYSINSAYTIQKE